MTAVQSHAPGAPCWIDLSTGDAEAAKRFYGELFGWTFEDSGPEFGHYNICAKDGAPVAGLMQKQSEDQPDAWTVYLATRDAEATAQKVTGTGGQIMVPAMKVGPLGTMMVAVDPAGAVIGAWQADQFSGIQRLEEHGTPAWFELNSAGYDTVLPFYRDAFGWKLHTMSDTPEFRYTTLGEGDAAKAGIMDSKGLPDVPPLWQVYIACDDVDATAAKLEGLGGQVIAPLFDTPYGRMGTFSDPTGARFCLMGRPA